MAVQRADAERNRRALITAATRLFVERGADIALDEIARTAGVSIATLYRNFSSREDLVAATHQSEIAWLTEVDTLLADATGAAAMTEWIGRIVDYSRTKRAIVEILHNLPTEPRSTAKRAVLTAIGIVLAAGDADGTLRGDVDAEDVLALLTGLWTLPPDDEGDLRARRLGQFVSDGLRSNITDS